PNVFLCCSTFSCMSSNKFPKDSIKVRCTPVIYCFAESAAFSENDFMLFIVSILFFTSFNFVSYFVYFFLFFYCFFSTSVLLCLFLLYFFLLNSIAYLNLKKPFQVLPKIARLQSYQLYAPYITPPFYFISAGVFSAKCSSFSTIS